MPCCSGAVSRSQPASPRLVPCREARRHWRRPRAIELTIPYQLDGQDGCLTAVRIATLDGRERLVPADALLAFFGLAMNLGPIADWGLGLDRNRIVVDPASCATDRAGLYAPATSPTTRASSN
jgi:thioredoxin reductase